MRTDWARARIDGADLRNAELAGADFFAASAVEAKFDRANLTGATLCAGNFAGASFVLADLCNARLEGAALSGADLRAADLRGAKLAFCDLESAWLWGAELDRDPKRASGARRTCRDLGFPSFTDAIELGPMHLLRITRPLAMHAVEGCLLGCEAPEPELTAMFNDGNWGMHLVASAALCLAGGGRAIEAAWAQLEKGSFVSPQIAAALSRVDASFPERVKPLQLDAKAAAAVTDLLEGRDGIATRWRTAITAFKPWSPGAV